MINLAVINKKDLIKYLIKLAVIIFFIITALNVFSNKDKKKEISINLINEKSATAFLDETIPGIKELNAKNNEEKTEDNEKYNPLGIALKMELGMLDTLIKKEQEENNGAISDEAVSITVEEQPQVIQAETRTKYSCNRK